LLAGCFVHFALNNDLEELSAPLDLQEFQKLMEETA
jgi:hypothetical protein